MPRAATHVARRADITHAGGESVEQLTVQRLVLQLLEEAPDVFVRDEIVASLSVLAFVSVHVGWRASETGHIIAKVKHTMRHRTSLWALCAHASGCLHDGVDVGPGIGAIGGGAFGLARGEQAVILRIDAGSIGGVEPEVFLWEGAGAGRACAIGADGVDGVSV